MLFDKLIAKKVAAAESEILKSTMPKWKICIIKCVVGGTIIEAIFKL